MLIAHIVGKNFFESPTQVYTETFIYGANIVKKKLN